LRITFCTWGGAPALLVRYEDGRVLAYAAMDGAKWTAEHPADVTMDGRVIDEAEFKALWPGLALPKFPAW